MCFLYNKDFRIMQQLGVSKLARGARPLPFARASGHALTAPCPAPVEEAPTVQDDTPDVADSVEEAIEPLAVAVAVEAETGVVEEEGVGDVGEQAALSALV